MAANCYTWFYRSPLVSDLITVNPSNTDTPALRTVATYSVSVQQLHLLVQIENTQLAGDNKYSFGFILRVLQFRIMPPVMLQGEPINATCFYVGPLSLMASGCNCRIPSHSGGGGEQWGKIHSKHPAVCRDVNLRNGVFNMRDVLEHVSVCHPIWHSVASSCPAMLHNVPENIRWHRVSYVQIIHSVSR